VRQWLVRFAAVTGKEASAALFNIWDEQLRDIAPDKLAPACDRLMKAWRYPNLPLPADVRAQLNDADATGFELETEKAWQSYRAWNDSNIYPDTGIRRGAPPLSPAVEHAARVAGGHRFLQRCSEEQLIWARKTFIAAYQNVHETKAIEHLLSNETAKQFLADVQSKIDQFDNQHARIETKAPAHVIDIPSWEQTSKPTNEEVHTFLDQIAAAPKPTLREVMKKLGPEDPASIYEGRNPQIDEGDIRATKVVDVNRAKEASDRLAREFVAAHSRNSSLPKNLAENEAITQ
jgi:hypothetical protein